MIESMDEYFAFKSNQLDEHLVYKTDEEKCIFEATEENLIHSDEFYMASKGMKDEEKAFIIQSESMRQALENLFQGISLTDIYFQRLSDLQMHIYQCTKEKKDLETSPFNNTLYQTKSKEEQRKLLIKKGFKYLEGQFFSNKKKKTKKKGRKKAAQLQFYEYYFKESAAKLDIDLSYFFHPQKFNCKITQKITRNFSYIQNY